MNYYAEIFDITKHELAESPYYDPRTGIYSWVDITKGQFWTLKDGRKHCFELGQRIGAAVPVKADSGYLLAATDGLYYYGDGKARRVLDLTGTYKSYQRSNDAKADPAGRLYFGCTADDGVHGPEGNLYMTYRPELYSNNSKVTIVQPDTKIANGMAVSSDRKTFYFSDSVEHAVFKYDYDLETGLLSNRRVLFEIKDGVPDGLTIDSEDNLWVAVWGGARIEKRDGVTGDLLGEIKVPATNTTSCCFAGPELKTLFITSSGLDLNGEFDGCLFTCEVDATGVEPDYVVL